MAHLPPPDDTPATNDSILDVLLHHQADLVVGLSTNPAALDTIVNFADLFSDAHPEPTATTLPGYARWQGRWETLTSDPTLATVRARVLFAVENSNPPAPITIQKWWAAVAQPPGHAPILIQTGEYDPAIVLQAQGDGIVTVVTLSAAQPVGAPAPVLSSTGGFATVPGTVGGGRAGLRGAEFRGQDRRMVEELQQALLRTQAHDLRIGSLSPNSRRSVIPILDPDDAGMTDAVQSIIERCAFLLVL